MKRILIVEDDLAFGTMIQTWLKKKGFDVERVTSVGAAIKAMGAGDAFHLVLSDLRLPDHDGLVLLQHIRKSDAHLPFIVMTSYAEVQNAVCAMKSGATDYVAKPFHPEILLEKIREAIQSAASAVSTPQRAESAAMQDAPQEEQQGATEVPRYIKGESEASKQLYEFVSLVAPTLMSVLILGASGTGKEYVARSIHEQSLRKDKPFYAVCAMKSGATDYVAKPFHPEILLEKIREAIQSAASAVSTPQRAESAAMQDAPQEEQQGATEVPRYIKGESEASKQLYEFVSLVAPTLMSVLILGASGTGKEYVARSIHEQSLRKDKPFYAIDCGAIPKEVAASEFFGYKKGAFTGAEQDKKGAFEIANGGTVFLDEMGNLNYEVQVQLLRALQERKIRPLGSTQEIDVDIRLICATNENLAQAVAEGKFREDLYHRINEFTIYMPALKDRGADIFLFANLFIKHANQELGKNVLGMDAKASEIIASYDWPGNLRELNNVMKRATLLTRGKYIGAQELEKTMAQTSTARPINMQLHSEQSEQESIAAALRATHGNKSKAAQLLAIDRKTLYNKMKKYGME